MDVKFDCTSCGQHIVIDEAGAGASVRCPTCNQSLFVPTKEKFSNKPALTANLSGVVRQAVTQLAKNIDEGLFEDDEKLDAFIRESKPEVLESVYGKKAADAFKCGEISAKQLLRSSAGGHELKPELLAEIKKIWRETK